MNSTQAHNTFYTGHLTEQQNLLNKDVKKLVHN